MRKIIFVLFFIFLIPACGFKPEVKDPVKRFEMLTEQKRELTKDYFKHLKSTNRDEKKLKDLDRKILSLNKEISKLSSDPKVKEYLDEQFGRRVAPDALEENQSSEAVSSDVKQNSRTSQDRVEYLSDDIEESIVDENKAGEGESEGLDPSQDEEYLGDSVDQEMEKDFNQNSEVEYEVDVSSSSEEGGEVDLQDSPDVEYYDDYDIDKE